ncbi:MAG: NADH-quinone oxidoreductase subunit C [Kofleriaceae bacterium]|nr:NADH-quinone oxidoreductase subunit C [Kofleriaceae bacterium]
MSQTVLNALKAKFGDDILDTVSAHSDETVVIAASKLIEVCTFLKDDPKMDFDSPVFLTCIDYLGHASTIDDDESPRYAYVVQLRSLSKRHRIRVKVYLQENSFKVPTLSGLWAGFNWLERETFDMYGIEFEKHPDLRRIYLYDEFVGYPLRKDYPKDKHQPLVRREWSDE